MTTKAMKLTVLGMLLAGYTLLVGCDMDDLFQSQYSVEGVEQNAVYVGLSGETRPAAAQGLPRLPNTITIKYENIKNQVPVTINGQSIGKLFTYGPKSATLNTNDIVNYLRQGKNTLSVDALSFGPSVDFVFDNQGPVIEVTRVEEVGGVLNLTARVDDSTTADSVFIERYNYSFDGGTAPSDVVSGQTNKVASWSKISGSETSFIPITGQNNEWRSVSSIQPAKLYKITAHDAYGYTSERWYLAPEEKLNNVFRLKLDKKILDYMMPMMPAQIRGSYMYAEGLLSYYGEQNPKLLYHEDGPGLVVGEAIPKGTTADKIKDPRNPKPSQVFDEMAKFWKKDAIFFGDTGNGAKTSNVNNCGFIQTDQLKAQAGLNGHPYAYPEGPWQDSSNNWHFPAGWVSGTHYKAGECSRIRMGFIQMNNIPSMSFTLHPSKPGFLNLDMKMGEGYVSGRALTLDLGMQHIKCGNGRKGQYCWDNGNVTAMVLANLSRNTVTATGGNPKGPIGVTIHNGDLALSIKSGDVKLNMDGLKLSGSIGGFVGGIVGLISGLLDGMFVDVAGSVIKQNMPHFIVGFDIFSEWDGKIDASVEGSGASLKMQSQGYQVTTNAGRQPAGQDPSWYMEYAGFLTPYMDRIKQKKIAGKLVYNVNDPDAVHPVLGSSFTPEDILMPLTDDNLGMAINLNIMNQALTSFYSAGLTHWTATSVKPNNHREEDCEDTAEVKCADLVKYMHAGNLWLANGPHRTDDADVFIAKKGDTRVVLVPRTPPIIEFEQTDKTMASLHYRNARMSVQSYTGDWVADGIDGWEVSFDVEVDLKIAAIMHIEDQAFQITLLGTPELTLNNVVFGGEKLFGISLSGLNIPGSVANRVVKGALQFGVDTLLETVVPVITQEYGTIKFPGIYIPAIDRNNPIPKSGNGVYISSETIKANNNEHLDFTMNFVQKPCTISDEDHDELVATHGKAMTFCEEPEN